MPQQINLYDDSLRPRPEPWRAVHGAWAIGLVLGVAGVAVAALDRHTLAQAKAAQAVEQQLQRERDLLARNGGLPGGAAGGTGATELQRLQQLDATQRRVQAMLAQQLGQSADGYTPLFLALARQAHPALWITGVAVSADGRSLELQGRMTDASVLPDYLRRLNAEPQFKGRRFEQLSLKTVMPTEGRPLIEFVLRSQPQRGEAAR